MNHLIAASLLLMLAVAKSAGQGTILWNEAVNGPFSANYQNPTLLGSLSPGTNSIVGATEIEPTGPNYFVREDYFAFIVPSNSSITGVYLQIDKPNVWIWVGETSYLNELSHSTNPSNGDLLAQLSLSSIGVGAYGMYFANHDYQSFTSIANYRLDFVVIPEPSAMALGLTFAAGLAGARCWRGRWRNSE